MVCRRCTSNTDSALQSRRKQSASRRRHYLADATRVIFRDCHVTRRLAVGGERSQGCMSSPSSASTICTDPSLRRRDMHRVLRELRRRVQRTLVLSVQHRFVPAWQSRWRPRDSPNRLLRSRQAVTMGRSPSVRTLAHRVAPSQRCSRPHTAAAVSARRAHRRTGTQPVTHAGVWNAKGRDSGADLDLAAVPGAFVTVVCRVPALRFAATHITLTSLY